MQGNKAKKCVVCGAQGVVKVNGAVWLCERCGMLATIGSLRLGIPVVMAHKGIPKELLMPKSFSDN